MLKVMPSSSRDHGNLDMSRLYVSLRHCSSRCLNGTEKSYDCYQPKSQIEFQRRGYSFACIEKHGDTDRD